MSELMLFTLFDRPISEVGDVLDRSKLKFEGSEPHQSGNLRTRKGVYTFSDMRFEMWGSDFIDSMSEGFLPRPKYAGLERYETLLSYTGTSEKKLHLVLAHVWTHLSRNQMEFSVINPRHCPLRLETFYQIRTGIGHKGKEFVRAAREIIYS